MIWDYIQLCLLLLTIGWLIFLCVAMIMVTYNSYKKSDKSIGWIQTIGIIASVFIPTVYLIGLFFWRIFQMVN